MLKFLRPHLLRWMRVPHDPEPPLGAPGSIRVFRAADNFYYFRLARWILTQVGAAIGILVSIGFISGLRAEYEALREQPAPAVTATPAAPNPGPAANAATASAANTPATPATPTGSVTASKPFKLPKDMRTKRNREEAQRAFVQRVPWWVVPAIQIAELLGIIGFLIQLPVTFAAVRLDWELRWYIVTDRSLRIRAGLWSLQEITMSFANLQQVEVSQGPIQRLLGVADVRVQSAGGGGAPAGKGHDLDESLHSGVFHGVANAQEIRDLILDRLRHFREAGLGDPDDHHSAAPALAAAEAPRASGDTHAAAQELLAEARALRTAAEQATRT